MSVFCVIQRYFRKDLIEVHNLRKCISLFCHLVLIMRRASEGFRGAVGVLFIDFGGGFMELMGFHLLLLFKLYNTQLLTFLYVHCTS